MDDDFASVRKRILERLSAEKPRKIWLACSGGLDSMVLVHTLSTLRPQIPQQEMGVLHVNFRLRAQESDDDAAFVERTSLSLGLACRVLVVDKATHPEGLRGVQEWARDLRYAWFRSQMQKGDWLVLAHHRDDLVETVLMRIARGAHLGQLLGMQEFRDSYWRPLLTLPREVIWQEAIRQKISHREDSSNVKLIYSRNVMRHRILPELEALYPGIRQNLSNLAQDALDFVRFSEETRESSPLLTKAMLDTLPGAVARQRLAVFISHRLGERRVSRHILGLLVEALCSGETLSLNLTSQFRAVVKAGELRLDETSHQRSARWSQYSKRLLDQTPWTWLGEGIQFEKSKQVEAETR